MVNLRVGGMLKPSEGSIEEPLTVLAELQRQGLIRHLGLSNVTRREQWAEAQKIRRSCACRTFSTSHSETMTHLWTSSRRKA